MTDDGGKKEIGSTIPVSIPINLRGNEFSITPIHYVGSPREQTAATFRPIIQEIQARIGSGQGSYELELAFASPEGIAVAALISQEIKGNDRVGNPDLVDRQLGDGNQTRLYYQTSVWLDNNAIDIQVTDKLLRPLRPGLYRFIVVTDKPIFGKRIKSIGFSWLSEKDIPELGKRRASFNEYLLPNLDKRLNPQEIRDLSGFVKY